MILCIDIGNTHLFSGVFHKGALLQSFRYDSQQAGTSDQLGIFLTQVIRHHGIDINEIHAISICSVVPHLDYTIQAACIKYFNIEPFLLKPGVKTGLNIQYYNPAEVGTDRIANAVAARNKYPNKNLIVIDNGTATNYSAINASGAFLGGIITPGCKLSAHALQQHTAQLPSVEIIKPKQILGRSTKENLQSGIYYGQLGMIKEITTTLRQTHFKDQPCVRVATGGFANLFQSSGCFDTVVPNLILEGLYQVYQLNHAKQATPTT
jgi:type III pantothenate kinase